MIFNIKFVRKRIVFWRKNLHSWEKFYTTTDRDGRDKFQVWLIHSCLEDLTNVMLRNVLTTVWSRFWSWGLIEIFNLDFGHIIYTYETFFYHLIYIFKAFCCWSFCNIFLCSINLPSVGNWRLRRAMFTFWHLGPALREGVQKKWKLFFKTFAIKKFCHFRNTLERA